MWPENKKVFSDDLDLGFCGIPTTPMGSDFDRDGALAKPTPDPVDSEVDLLSGVQKFAIWVYCPLKQVIWGKLPLASNNLSEKCRFLWW